MSIGLVQTNDLRLFAVQWFREVAGQANEMAGATQETAINLCKLVSQENEWVRVYTGCAAKVLEEKIGQEEEEKKEEEEEKKEEEEEEEEE
jgi:hydrogenase maturation factor